MSTAVIIGDSQAGGAGKALQYRLENQGFTVKRWWKDGAGSHGVADLVSSHAADAKDAKLVVVFSGSTEGAAGGIVPAAKAVDNVWPTAHVMWYGSSPATRIGSVQAAQANFGKSVNSENHWFPKVAADREKRNAELPKLLPARFQYVDWRVLSLPDAVVQPSGVRFPVQLDGIHVTGPTAVAAFAPPNWPPPAAGAIATDQDTLAAILLLFFIILASKM